MHALKTHPSKSKESASRSQSYGFLGLVLTVVGAWGSGFSAFGFGLCFWAGGFELAWSLRGDIRTWWVVKSRISTLYRPLVENRSSRASLQKGLSGRPPAFVRDSISNPRQGRDSSESSALTVEFTQVLALWSPVTGTKLLPSPSRDNSSFLCKGSGLGSLGSLLLLEPALVHGHANQDPHEPYKQVLFGSGSRDVQHACSTVRSTRRTSQARTYWEKTRIRVVSCTIGPSSSS